MLEAAWGMEAAAAGPGRSAALAAVTQIVADWYTARDADFPYAGYDAKAEFWAARRAAE